MMKIAAAAAGAAMLACGLAQPAAAGDWGKKYRGHPHYKSHWHSRHRGFAHKGLFRRHSGHQRPTVRFTYVAPPRSIPVVRPYAPPRAARVAPPGAGIASTTCREYAKTVIIGGQSVPAYGRACLQPDGSWQLVPLD